MADSIVTIWQMALANIGSTAQLQGPNDTSKAGVQCQLWWANARQSVLRAYPWPFATITTTLQQIAGFTPPDYLYAFGVPADCLKALELLSPAGRRPPPKCRIPWKLRAYPNNGGVSRILVTDMMPGTADGGGLWDDDWGGCGVGRLAAGTPLPCLRYITDIVDPTMYPSEIDDAMAWQLASYLAMPLTQAKALKQGADQQARRSLLEACALNLDEQQDDPPQDAETQQARR